MDRHEGIGGRLEPGLLSGKKAPAAIGILSGSQNLETGGERIAHYNFILMLWRTTLERIGAMPIIL
jgi:hypothetical protein